MDLVPIVEEKIVPISFSFLSNHRVLTQFICEISFIVYSCNSFVRSHSSLALLAAFSCASSIVNQYFFALYIQDFTDIKALLGKSFCKFAALFFSTSSVRRERLRFPPHSVPLHGIRFLPLSFYCPLPSTCPKIYRDIQRGSPARRFHYVRSLHPFVPPPI